MSNSTCSTSPTPPRGHRPTGSTRRRLGDAGELLDREARVSYRRRLEQLRDARDDAEAVGDDDTVARIEEEMHALAVELARAVGLGGHDRRAASASERARVNVTRALRSAIDRVGEAHPELAAHLHRSVRTGVFCAYNPPADEVITWSWSAARGT